MSFLALPPARWITPQEQLDRLSPPIAHEVSEGSGMIPPLAKIVAQYTNEPYTHWHIALSELRLLPERIPPLPRNIHQIMEGKCPVYSTKQTDLKVRDTHILALVLKEFGSLNNMQNNILKPYRERKGLEEEYFELGRSNQVDAQEFDVEFPDTHWILATKGLLPESIKRHWRQQGDLINALNKRFFQTYEIPTLQQAYTAVTTDMVATEKSRLWRGPGGELISTLVQGAVQDRRLVLGRSRMRVMEHPDTSGGYFGTMVVRKLDS